MYKYFNKQKSKNKRSIQLSIAVTPRVSDSQWWEWGLRICILSKFPGDIEAASPETILQKPLLHSFI